MGSWFSFGANTCGREAPPSSSKEKYPQIYFLGCCKVIILSSQHVALMVLLLLGFAIFALHLIFIIVAAANASKDSEKGHTYSSVSLMGIGVVQIVVVLLLVKFEE